MRTGFSINTFLREMSQFTPFKGIVHMYGFEGLIYNRKTFASELCS